MLSTCRVVDFLGSFEPFFVFLVKVELLQILVNTFCATIWYRNSAHSPAPEIIDQDDFRGK